MYPEGEVVVRAMLEFKKAYGVPALSVHDSIIVRGRYRLVAAEALSLNYQRACSVRPEFG